MAKISLTILGDPKAQKRHRTMTRDRRGQALRFPHQIDPSKVDKKDFLAVVQHKAPEQPLTGPLSVTIVFFMPRPQQHYRTGKHAGELKDNAPLWCAKNSDLDNLVKFVFDALNTVFWQDDRQIVRLTAMKIYDAKPRTEILIETLV